MEKLGVRAGSAVLLAGLEDDEFAAELAGRGARLEAAPPFDLIFLGVRAPDDLEQLAFLRPRLRPAGAIWVVRAKGNPRSVGEMDIIDAGKRHGLVDNKIASFSETHSAMRLVIPVAQRRKSGGT